MRAKLLLILLYIFIFLANSYIMAQADPSLNITITEEGTYPRVDFENSIFKASIRAQAGGDAGIEHAFRDLVIKGSPDIDIVSDYLDASTHRGPCTLATVTDNGVDSKTVRLKYFYSDEYNEYNGIVDYTIFANSPVIKVDYIQYDYSGGWANHVDWTTIENGQHLIFGQDGYGPHVFHPNVYWNASSTGTDTSDGGSLNILDHMIMVYGQSGDNGIGYGRIMPIFYQSEPGKPNQGGISILKLLSGIRGYEVFSAVAQGYKPSFTGFLYVFSNGRENGLNFGVDVADAHVNGNTLPLPVELSAFTAKTISNGIRLDWTTETEVNNYGFEVERKTENSDWVKIGFVNGSGNSNSVKAYSYIDQNEVSGTINYRLKQVDNDGTFEYSKTVEVSSSQPAEFALAQNYPNPFNPSTIISYNLAEQSQIKLQVFNSIGEQVKEIESGIKAAGNHKLQFNASGLTSGTYIYVLSGTSASGESFRFANKMSIIK